MPHLTTLSAAFAEWFQANKVQKQPNGSHVQAQSTGPGHIPGEKGFLRLFWTGDSLSLSATREPLQVICSSQLVVNISLCWAYLDLCSCGGGHRAWKITPGWFAFLSTASQAGWPQREALHTANITSQLLLSPVTGLKRLIRYIQAF